MRLNIKITFLFILLGVFFFAGCSKKIESVYGYYYHGGGMILKYAGGLPNNLKIDNNQIQYSGLLSPYRPISGGDGNPPYYLYIPDKLIHEHIPEEGSIISVETNLVTTGRGEYTLVNSELKGRTITNYLEQTGINFNRHTNEFKIKVMTREEFYNNPKIINLINEWSKSKNIKYLAHLCAIRGAIEDIQNIMTHWNEISDYYKYSPRVSGGILSMVEDKFQALDGNLLATPGGQDFIVDIYRFKTKSTGFLNTLDAKICEVGKPLLPVMEKMLEDESLKEIHYRIVKNIARIGDEKNIPLFAQYLSVESSYTYKALIKFAGPLAAAEISKRIDTIIKNKERIPAYCFTILTYQGEAGTDVLIKLYNTIDRRTGTLKSAEFIDLLSALGRTKSGKAYPILYNMAMNSNEKYQINALRTLHHFGKRNNSAEFKRLINTAFSMNQSQLKTAKVNIISPALDVLGSTGDPSLSNYIINILNHKDLNTIARCDLIITSALNALANIKSPSLLPTLEKYSQINTKFTTPPSNNNEMLKNILTAVVHILGDMGGGGALPVLMGTFDHPNKEIIPVKDLLDILLANYDKPSIIESVKEIYNKNESDEFKNRILTALNDIDPGECEKFVSGI